MKALITEHKQHMSELDPKMIEVARETAARRIIDPAIRPGIEDVIIDGIQSYIASVPTNRAETVQGEVDEH